MSGASEIDSDKGSEVDPESEEESAYTESTEAQI